MQKVLADRGVASRRAAEELMREGRVRVGGEVIREMGTRIAPDAPIEVDGQAVAPPAPHRYVLLNKPRGIVSTARGVPPAMRPSSLLVTGFSATKRMASIAFARSERMWLPSS